VQSLHLQIFLALKVIALIHLIHKFRSARGGFHPELRFVGLLL